VAGVSGSDVRIIGFVCTNSVDTCVNIAMKELGIDYDSKLLRDGVRRADPVHNRRVLVEGSRLAGSCYPGCYPTGA
jgi:hypothetical protein